MATSVALFVLNFWLRELPLLAVVDCVEFRFQSKVTDRIDLQNLPSLYIHSRTHFFIRNLDQAIVLKVS